MPDADHLQALLARCARQDRAAFEELYRLTSPKLFSLCSYLLRRQSLAEDALQEAFMQIWRDAGRFDPARSQPMTWMGVIVRHRALDLLRRQRPATSLDDQPWLAEGEDDQPGPLEGLLDWANAQELKRCLDELTEQHRESVILAFLRGLTHQQLSEHLATPLGTVKSWVRRGLGQLQRCLET